MNVFPSASEVNVWPDFENNSVDIFQQDHSDPDDPALICIPTIYIPALIKALRETARQVKDAAKDRG